MRYDYHNIHRVNTTEIQLLGEFEPGRIKGGLGDASPTPSSARRRQVCWEFYSRVLRARRAMKHGLTR